MPRPIVRPNSVRLPVDVVLNSRSIAAIACRFPAEEIGDLIERLIECLDAITGDTDLEPDAEFCRA